MKKRDFIKRFGALGLIPFSQSIRYTSLNKLENLLNKKESNRFLKIVQNLKKIKSGQLDKLNIEVKKSKIKRNFKKGIF